MLQAVSERKQTPDPLEPTPWPLWTKTKTTSTQRVWKEGQEKWWRDLLHHFKLVVQAPMDHAVDPMGVREVELVLLKGHVSEELLALRNVQHAYSIDEANEEVAEHLALLHGLSQLEVRPEAWLWQVGRRFTGIGGQPPCADKHAAKPWVKR